MYLSRSQKEKLKKYISQNGVELVIDMTKLTKEKVLSIGTGYLEKKQINISPTNSINVNFKPNERLRDGSFRDVWIFGYEVNFFSEEKWMFLIISDEDGKILYGVHDTGYFEIKD